MISYKYSIVICNWGCHYFVIILCFWCSHLECSDSCLNVSYFCEFMFMELWLSQKFIALFLVVRSFNSGVCYGFTNFSDISSSEEIIKFCLCNFSSRMSALFVALRFDEGWNILWLLSFSPTIASMESGRHYSYFHWLLLISSKD